MLTSFTRWFLLWFLATVVLLCLGLGIRVVAAATEEARATPATDPRPDFVTALQATGPCRGDDAEVAGRLVGYHTKLRGAAPPVH